MKARRTAMDCWGCPGSFQLQLKTIGVRTDQNSESPAKSHR